MKAAETCAGSAGIQVVIGRAAGLKTVVAARLAGIDLVNCATVSAGIEMATCARLRVVAAGLHVPEESFTELDGGRSVGENSFHAEDRRHCDAGQGSKRTQRDDDGAAVGCALGANMTEISDGNDEYGYAHENTQKGIVPGTPLHHALSPKPLAGAVGADT